VGGEPASLAHSVVCPVSVDIENVNIEAAGPCPLHYIGRSRTAASGMLM
jgi:hypothetical protein